MAKTGRGTTARRNRNTVRNSREMYVQGNAVKRLQEVPQRTDLPEIQERRRLAQKRKIRSTCDTGKTGGKQTGTAEPGKGNGHEQGVRSVSYGSFHRGTFYLYQLSSGKIRNHGEYEKCCKSGI